MHKPFDTAAGINRQLVVGAWMSNNLTLHSSHFGAIALIAAPSSLTSTRALATLGFELQAVWPARTRVGRLAQRYRALR